MKKEKGFNIDTTKGQYMMLYNIIAEYNPKDADPNFDMQTFDNLYSLRMIFPRYHTLKDVSHQSYHKRHNMP